MRNNACRRLCLFHDLRHIRCGDLEWHDLQGRPLPLTRPPEPPVKVAATPRFMPRGVRLAAQKPVKSDPLPPHVRLGTVIHEHGVYRSWTLDVRYPPEQDHGVYSKTAPLSLSVAVTESQDGFNWTAPQNSPLNAPGQTAPDGFTVFHDPGAPPAERYKAIYMAVPPPEQSADLWTRFLQMNPRRRDERLRADYLSCLYGAVSPDGIRWTALPDPLLVHKSDTDTTAYYDDVLRKYVLYTRLYRQERRWVGRAESDDFRRWSHVEALLWPSLDGPWTDDLYLNGRTAYPGLPDAHLMFPMTYHRNNETSDVSLYSSADGIAWMRVPGGPILTPGPEGAWDSAYISVWHNLVPWSGDRVALRYRGTPFPHKHPRWPHVLDAARTGWVFWPKERLVAVVADAQGEFTTVPLPPAGRRLSLNLRTRPGGSVRVGLLGVPGRAATDCDPISGDRLAAPVHWRGDAALRAPEGRPLALHILLDRADLFAVEWMT